MKRWKTALITGAGAGIGKALCEALLADGADIVAIDRQPIVWTKGRADEGRIMPVIADLADREDVLRLVDELQAFGPFDLVVHNAGVSATGRFEAIPDEAYLRLIAVNAEAPMVLAGALMRDKLYAPGASLVFISSLSHATGYPGAAVYAASKDAIAIYAKSMRKPFARAGVYVTCVFPGPVRTDHAARHAPKDADAARRMAPEDLAKRILASAARRKPNLYPGLSASAAHIGGVLAPNTMTRLMRRVIFDRLNGEVW